MNTKNGAASTSLNSASESECCTPCSLYTGGSECAPLLCEWETEQTEEEGNNRKSKEMKGAMREKRDMPRDENKMEGNEMKREDMTAIDRK